MRHLGLEVHRLEKLMADLQAMLDNSPYTNKGTNIRTQTGRPACTGICFAICTKIRNGTCSSGTLKRRFPLAVPR